MAKPRTAVGFHFKQRASCPVTGSQEEQSSKSMEYTEGHEVMDEDEGSDTEMTSGQGAFIACTGDQKMLFGI